jgi:hypothetical protein
MTHKSSRKKKSPTKTGKMYTRRVHSPKAYKLSPLLLVAVGAVGGVGLTKGLEYYRKGQKRLEDNLVKQEKSGGIISTIGTVIGNFVFGASG